MDEFVNKDGGGIVNDNRNCNCNCDKDEDIIDEENEVQCANRDGNKNDNRSRIRNEEVDIHYDTVPYGESRVKFLNGVGGRTIIGIETEMIIRIETTRRHGSSVQSARKVINKDGGGIVDDNIILQLRQECG